MVFVAPCENELEPFEVGFFINNCIFPIAIDPDKR